MFVWKPVEKKWPDDRLFCTSNAWYLQFFISSILAVQFFSFSLILGGIFRERPEESVRTETGVTLTCFNNTWIIFFGAKVK